MIPKIWKHFRSTCTCIYRLLNNHVLLIRQTIHFSIHDLATMKFREIILQNLSLTMKRIKVGETSDALVLKVFSIALDMNLNNKYSICRIVNKL